ncbi:hypothetical protein THAOC_37905 [Thalassiosira oceanica]|uniref:Uncharacterized protein n=1 Tax=Thalassiosira oceanica TaxID=159749 RepID=K0RAW9_THAOC|nr:hypothetical protein THAOC_37905 [Thalassiosira oceanica]|eukprot:EJK43632.1 hypothetical protein THAOC_37905 [Thalassiosira oceanica]
MRYPVTDVVPCHREHELRPPRSEHVPVQPIECPSRAQAGPLHPGGPVPEPVAPLAPPVRALPPDRLRGVDVDADRLQEHGPAESFRMIPQELERVARTDARAEDVTPLYAEVVEQGHLVVAKGGPPEIVRVPGAAGVAPHPGGRAHPTPREQEDRYPVPPAVDLVADPGPVGTHERGSEAPATFAPGDQSPSRDGERKRRGDPGEAEEARSVASESVVEERPVAGLQETPRIRADTGGIFGA